MNQPYEDILIHPSEQSTYELLSPFRQLPLLVVDETHRLSHDLPICRYLAELGNLRGSNSAEASTCDMIVEQLRDCIVERTSKSSRDMSIVERTLTGLEKLVSLNGSGKYVVGCTMTWADLAMVNAWEWLMSEHTTRMLMSNQFPLIKQHNDFVRATPVVDEWFRRQKPLGRVKNV